MKVLTATSSDDGATKFLLDTSTGGRVEAVFLVMDHDGKDSLCVSSQVGCGLRCSFCATGLVGLMRDLSAAEIVEQVEVCLAAAGFTQRRRFDLSYMGMGEPLRNIGAVLESKRELQRLHPGFRFYVSTVGLPDGIRELSRHAPDMGLQISAHSADDKVRRRLIPVSRAHPLAEVLEAAEEHAAVCDKPVTLNYCLMAGVNDSPADAHRLADMVTGRPFRVQVVNFNAQEPLPYRPTDPGTAHAFVETLKTRAIPVHYGLQLGKLEGAGCGQLDADYRTGELTALGRRRTRLPLLPADTRDGATT